MVVFEFVTSLMLVALDFQSSVELLLPVVVGDYTDFFTSLHHTKNCGLIFRGPQTPVLDNWCVDLKVFTNALEYFFFL